MKEFNLTFKDYVEAQNLHMGWKRVPIAIAILGPLIILLIYINKSLVAQPEIEIIILSFVIGLFLSKFFRKRFLYKIYNSHKTLHERIKIIFNDEYIKWETASGNFKTTWQNIYKYKFNDKVIVIYDAINVIRPIPFIAFETEEEKTVFLSNLKNKCSYK